MIAHLVVMLWLAQPPGTLVDEVVAVVDKEVITHSELVNEARIALAESRGERGAFTEPDRRFLKAFRDYLVNEVLIAEQARRLGVVEVSAQDVDRAMRHFVNGFRSEDSYRAFLHRYDISEAMLRDVLRRKLRNEAYVAERMRSRMVGFRGTPAQRRARYQKALKTWLDELHSRAEIRLLGPSGDLELQ